MANVTTMLKKSKSSHPDFTVIASGLGTEFSSRAAMADDNDLFVAENIEALRKSGLVEAGVPTDLGGGGATLQELADMLRLMAHSCSSTALAFAMHTHQVAVPAWRWTNQKVEAVTPLLKRVATEKILLLSSGGADWIAGSGKAEKVDGGYRITARKIFTSGAPTGDLLMTMAVLSEPGKEPQVLHFGIPMKSPHVRIEPVWKTMGMRGTGSHDVIIDGHVVPEAAIPLTRKAGEWHPVFQIIAGIAFPLIYAVYTGVAERARDVALDMAKQRRPNSHVTYQMGLLENEICGAQLALQHMLNVGQSSSFSAATVNETMKGRTLVATHVLKAVDLAMEVAGGKGFFRDAGLERLFRDAQGARYHPMQPGQQAEYAGSMALGLPIEKIF